MLCQDRRDCCLEGWKLCFFGMELDGMDRDGCEPHVLAASSAGYLEQLGMRMDGSG